MNRVPWQRQYSWVSLPGCEIGSHDAASRLWQAHTHANSPHEISDLRSRSLSSFHQNLRIIRFWSCICSLPSTDLHHRAGVAALGHGMPLSPCAAVTIAQDRLPNDASKSPSTPPDLGLRRNTYSAPSGSSSYARQCHHRPVQSPSYLRGAPPHDIRTRSGIA